MQELSADIANFGSQKEQRTKAAQAKLKAAKQGLEASKKAAKETSQKLTQAAAEAEAATSERQSLTEQLQVAHKALQGMSMLATSCALHAQIVMVSSLREEHAAPSSANRARHVVRACMDATAGSA